MGGWQIRPVALRAHLMALGVVKVTLLWDTCFLPRCPRTWIPCPGQSRIGLEPVPGLQHEPAVCPTVQFAH
eukprot:CAMPEP_0170646252 /NCGR_PEP_ID=MMETSP0224-20130122/43534_1 /TAXON_ID=285029 /ORGANISM="Togula jolla, Strain CCCM 725" /LENGTH=70 /DNA_ID=CAMNT_0010977563 /DNA_START=171 /DNA_END=383 /DNA_ORIENTATION=-